MLVVQKYGGSSLATPKMIKTIAKRIVDRYLNDNDQFVIVVSAMGKTTDELVKKAYEISENPDTREMDMLLSVGERLSISLMSIAINELVPGLAVSYTGSQIGLITDCNHRDARIVEIKGDRLKQALSEGKIPVVAGFQGVSTKKEITTLGRGGSDTTAVAITSVINADHCEIYSDIDGVYSIDPKLTELSQKIDEISFDDMLEVAISGAKVLKEEAVEYAKRLNIKIKAGSSKTGNIGTIVTDNVLNRKIITAMVYYDKLFHFSKKSFPDEIEKENPFLGFHDARFFQKNIDRTLYIYDEKYIHDIITKKENPEQCYSLSFIGAGIRAEQEIISNVFKILSRGSENKKNYLLNILATEFSGTKYILYFNEEIPKNIIEKIHKTLFN